MAEVTENDKDSRGLLTPAAADMVRRLRADEAYEIHDSIVVGQGARDLDDGWFNNFSQMANASTLAWFGGRSANVSRALSNQSDSRRDWAFDCYMFSVEYFVITPHNAEFLTDIRDAQLIPDLWVDSLANSMGFRIKLAQADDILEIPGMVAASGVGRTGAVANASVDGVYIQGSTGQAHVSNSWKWPRPVMLPAQGQIAVYSQIDMPLKQLFTALTDAPGTFNIPITPAPFVFESPVWYVIRCRFTGARYLQLRGARSAAGATAGR
jgi:hypothetical protein